MLYIYIYIYPLHVARVDADLDQGVRGPLRAHPGAPIRSVFIISNHKMSN